MRGTTEVEAAPTPGILARTCAAVRCVLRLAEPSPDRWLGIACENAVTITGPGFGAHAFVAAASGGARTGGVGKSAGWSMHHAAAAGYPRRGAGGSPLEQARHTWSDEVLRAAPGDAEPEVLWAKSFSNARAGSPRVVVRPQRKAPPGVRGARSGGRRAHLATGLQDFVRARMVFADVDGRRLLILRVDALDAAPAPGESLREAISAFAPAVLEGFVERHVRARLRQHALIEQLGPGQRLVAPLLVAGRPESWIAREIGRSTGTVHKHAHTIYLNWKVQNRYEMRDLWFGVEGAPGYEPAIR